MATDAQIKANRMNAQKSTGPRSAEGKEAVSQNATKHGLCSSKNVIKTESQEQYNLFHDEMIEDMAPAGAMELVLAERIVNLSWRLKRAEVFQNVLMDALMDFGINDMVFGWADKGLKRAREQAQSGNIETILGIVVHEDFANANILEKVLVYEKRIESSLYKATAELRKLQKIRREAETIDDGRERIDEGRCRMDEGRSVREDGGETNDELKIQSQSEGENGIENNKDCHDYFAEATKSRNDIREQDLNTDENVRLRSQGAP